MALTISPADGLINRLLQQNNQVNASKPSSARADSVRAEDSVSISLQARQQADTDISKVNDRQNQSRLESQLLRLYTHHGNVRDDK